MVQNVPVSGLQCQTTVLGAFDEGMLDIHLYTTEVQHLRLRQHDPKNRLSDIPSFSFKESPISLVNGLQESTEPELFDAYNQVS